MLNPEEKSYFKCEKRRIIINGILNLDNPYLLGPKGAYVLGCSDKKFETRTFKIQTVKKVRGSVIKGSAAIGVLAEMTNDTEDVNPNYLEQKARPLVDPICAACLGLTYPKPEETKTIRVTVRDI